MKGVVIRKPHDAEYGELPQPRITDHQVLVRVAVAGVCMSDVEVYDGTRPEKYVTYPCIPGHEWCGTVVRVHGIFAYTSQVFQKTLRQIEDGALDLRGFITHRFPLGQFLRAFDLLRQRPEPVLKILLRP